MDYAVQVMQMKRDLDKYKIECKRKDAEIKKLTLSLNLYKFYISNVLHKKQNTPHNLPSTVYNINGNAKQSNAFKY